MSYEKIRIKKLKTGNTFPFPQIENIAEKALEKMLLEKELKNQESLKMVSGTYSDFGVDQKLSAPTTYLSMTKKVADTSGLSFNTSTNKVEGGINITDQEVTPEEMFGSENNSTLQENPLPLTETTGPTKEEKMRKAAAIMGVVGEAATMAINQVDQATMGDKNFSAPSQALDAGVHGVSSTLMKTGNPYAIAAGVALEGLNFATKAGGQNVPGYSVNINNSGYGQLGRQESEAGRVWDKWSGVTALKLKRRNEQARMALSAQSISEDVKYEQEARANSVDNVLRQNQIALAGGTDTSLLAN